jgi:hypothetical protein
VGEGTQRTYSSPFGHHSYVFIPQLFGRKSCIFTTANINPNIQPASEFEIRNLQARIDEITIAEM